MGGQAASDIARESADLIFLNDDFSNIVISLEAGRQAFDAIRKTCAYTLSHAAPELIPIFLDLGMLKHTILEIKIVALFLWISKFLSPFLSFFLSFSLQVLVFLWHYQDF